MGTVYVAHDPVLGRMVAIKVFAGDLDVPDARERFSREARAAAALNHPNIVTVYDFGEYQSQPYIVMEYVPGETMANLIRRKVPMTIGDKLRWMEELCAGAGYAHQMSVVHRDIKPANLMIDRSGRLKILDFGIARMLGIASNTSVMIGTPGYMAPEQITGDPVDHRSDQFSIGVVFYELLSHVEPFAGDTLPMITHRIVSQEPTPLEQLVPDLSPEIVAIVTQALKKASANRFRDTDAMRSAISRLRRHYESDTDWNTMPVGRDITPPAGGNRGTGSARRRSNDSIGVAQLTPPPDPRRTDREAIARRRTMQVEAALLLGRTLLEKQQLEDAMEACQQALTLDETHAGAIELEEQVQKAIRVRDGLEVDDAALNATSANTFSGSLLESQAVTRFDQDALAFTPPPAPPPPALAPEARKAEPAPVSPPVSEKTAVRITPAVPGDATIIAPVRRTPAPTSPPRATTPPAAAAVPPPAAALPAPPTATKLPAAAARSPQAKPAKVPVKKDGPSFLVPVMASISSALKSIGPVVSGIGKTVHGPGAGSTAQKKTLPLLIAAGVVVLAIAGVSVYLLTRGPVPTGTVVVDALPWANVTSIRSEGGDEIPVPPMAETPLALSLPEGTYQITLTGPPPESKTAQVSIQVTVGGRSLTPVTRFQSPTVEQYFEQILAVEAPPAVDPAALAPGDPAAPAPASVPAQAAPTGAAQ
jgi:hypothetical protein